MNNYKLYDAITHIDDWIIERADSLRQRHLFISKSNTAVSHVRVTKRNRAVIAALITVVVFSFIVVLSSVMIKESSVKTHNLPSITEQVSGTIVRSDITDQVTNPSIITGNIIEVSNLESISRGNDKESPPSYFSIMSIPSIVRNNSNFTFECSFGLDQREWMFLFSEYNPDLTDTVGDLYDFGVLIANREYEADPYIGVHASDGILLFGSNGDYTELIDYERMKEEFTLDSGATLVTENGRKKIIYTNIKDSSSLPFHISVSCTLNDLSIGTKGIITASFFSDAKNGSSYMSNGSKVYYYCSGDFIGFGTSEEEALENSFYSSDQTNPIETFDRNREQNEKGYITGAF